MAPSIGHFDPLTDALERARQLYAELGDTLMAAITRLKGEQQLNRATPPKETLELVRAHQKALLMLLELETDLQKRGPEKTRQGSNHELDLESARTEVIGRLSRLRSIGKV